jgi:pimeloyl-ACP methyl ester carboxylesterase
VVWSAFDVEWEDPAIRLFYQGLVSDARFIHFDRRGSGPSDPIVIDSLPPLEAYADETEAVMDAVGSNRAVTMGAGAAEPAVGSSTH